jgi:Domain of unknown function (DUF6378)
MRYSDILKSAIVAVEKGTDKHGDTAKSFEMIGQLWATYIAHTMAKRKVVSLTGFDVANMMMMVKQVRSVYGHSVDNQVDAAGYAAIAAVLNPDPMIEDLAEELRKGIEE